MKKVKYLLLSFKNPLMAYEVQYFRSAVIEAAERASVLFHNHKGDAGFRHDYPLIQYKVVDKRAAILCLDEGVDDVHYFLRNADIALRIGNRPPERFVLDRIEVKQVLLQAWERDFGYSLKSWLALNPENYPKYRSLDNDRDRGKLLESILVGNILSLASGLDWNIDREVKARVELPIAPPKSLKYKPEMRFDAFDLRVHLNVALPDYLGIGKGAAKGYGSLRRMLPRRPAPQPAGGAEMAE